jgi:signal transduction histidine kinase
VVADSLPDQAGWLPFANGVIAVLDLVAAVGFAFRAQHLRTPHLHTIAITLSLIAFAHLHALFFPPLDASYVSAGDVFGLVGYVIMLCGLARHMGREITEHVSRDERLRLSRELHDGLTQHLGLLHLRLNQAVAPRRNAERRAQDLEAARRLVEAALIEARQAVISLRVDAITWDQFQHSVRTFTHEFGRNHDVQMDLAIEGAGINTDAGLQAEVLRILHEAFSNAVRHGEARAIATWVAVYPPDLQVVVRDDGCGFDASHRIDDHGVGLVSMQERIGRRGGTLALESAVGRGTTLRVALPLRGSEGARP